MRHCRSVLAIFLLLLFAWGRVADAAPLVWCLGSDGHSVIEYAGRDGCRTTIQPDLSVDSGYETSLIGEVVGEHGHCKDVAVPDEIRSPIKTSNTPLVPAPTSFVIETFKPNQIFWAECLASAVDPGAGHLIQLRTVVLRL